MNISLRDKTTLIGWRRVAIIGNAQALEKAGVVLTYAGIPNIVGRYRPCKSLVARKRVEESVGYWLLVPVNHYSAACSLLFPLSEAPGENENCKEGDLSQRQESQE